MGRMYKLVERTQFGLLDMVIILEKHITRMGHEAIASQGSNALNVSRSLYALMGVKVCMTEWE